MPAKGRHRCECIKDSVKGKFSGQGLFVRDCEDTEPLQIINEIGVDIYPAGVYHKDS